MSETAAPADSATAPSATPFEQDIGEFFGDYSTSGETPESSESAAGTTPAEPADDPVDGAASEPAAAADGAPETPSDGTTPAAATTTPGDDDPFKETTAAQYVLNGQTIPVEDIRVFKEGGAVIRPEALPNVLSKLAERDTLSEKLRARDTDYQTLSKVSEWTGPDNQTVSGPQAAIERIVAHAAVVSENELLIRELIQCPDLHAAGFLVTTPDGNGVMFNPAAIKALQTQNELRQLKATQAIREHFGKLVTETAKGQPAPVNFETEAPKLIQAIAEQSKLDASVLTPADRILLTKQLPAHTQNGKVSAAWQELVADRIQIRTEQKASSQKLVTTTADATKKGLANMAAAARGVKPATPKPVAAPPKPVTPAQERSRNEGDAFDALLNSGAAAMRIAR